jgi:hypothetical protein
MKPNVQIPKALSFASYLALRYGISVGIFRIHFVWQNELLCFGQKFHHYNPKVL